MQPDILIIPIISALIGFGIAFYIQNLILRRPHTRVQRVLLIIAATSLGYGLMTVITESLLWLMLGKQPNLDRIFKGIIANIIAIPAIIALPYYLFKSKEPLKSNNIYSAIKLQQAAYWNISSPSAHIKYAFLVLSVLLASAYYYFKVYSNEYFVYDCTKSENNSTPAPHVSGYTGFTISGSSLIFLM